jgi:uncharacterized protein
MHRKLLLLVVLVVAALAGPIVHAQGGYPPYEDLYVNDYAMVLTAEDAAHIRSMFMDLKRDHGIEAVVLTIHTLSNYTTGDETIEQFATNLFNTWGIGDATRNDGVLILVAVDDRKVRIEIGAGYAPSYDDVMAEVITEHMLPYFRRNEYSLGIYRGARAVVGELTGDWPDDLTPVTGGSNTTTTTTAPAYTTTEEDSGGGINPWILGGGGLGIAGAGAYGARQVLRYRPRRCANCGARMTRLDEAGDDVYLDSGQKLEELLNSVDYDIWKCPNCNNHDLYRYPSLLSRLQRCPQCGYRTVRTSSTTLVAATTHSTGQKQVTKDCNNCHFHSEEIVVIPRISQSSGSSSGGGGSHSSGGSFGGGRSSGGGASGSW